MIHILSKKLIQTPTLALFALAIAVRNVYAQIGLENPPTKSGVITDINSVISFGVTMILIVAGLIAFVYLLLGGIKWITSGGDSGAVEAARGQIIQALIGLIVVLAAWALISLVQEATGACFGIGCTITLPTI